MSWTSNADYAGSLSVGEPSCVTCSVISDGKRSSHREVKVLGGDPAVPT